MPVDTSYCQFWHVNAIMLSEKDILEVKSVYLEKVLDPMAAQNPGNSLISFALTLWVRASALAVRLLCVSRLDQFCWPLTRTIKRRMKRVSGISMRINRTPRDDAMGTSPASQYSHMRMANT